MLPVSEVLAFIERLRGGGAERMEWSDLRSRINQLLDGTLVETAGLPFNAESQKPQPIIRLRALDSERFDRLSDLSYRPRSACNDYGRCHRPSEPAFYGSFSIPTALSEVGAIAGRRYQGLMLRQKVGARLGLYTVGDITHTRRWGNSYLPRLESSKLADHLGNILDPGDTALRTYLLDAYLSEAFSQRAENERSYRVTSAFADLLFRKGFPGILYPSVAHNGGFNIALHPDAADEHFEVDSSAVLEVIEAFGYGIYRTKVVQQTSLLRDGAFVDWEDLTEK